MHYEINFLQLTTMDVHSGNAHARLAADQPTRRRHSLRRWIIMHITLVLRRRLLSTLFLSDPSAKGGSDCQI